MLIEIEASALMIHSLVHQAQFTCDYLDLMLLRVYKQLIGECFLREQKLGNPLPDTVPQHEVLRPHHSLSNQFLKTIVCKHLDSGLWINHVHRFDNVEHMQHYLSLVSEVVLQLLLDCFIFTVSVVIVLLLFVAIQRVQSGLEFLDPCGFNLLQESLIAVPSLLLLVNREVTNKLNHVQKTGG